MSIEFFDGEFFAKKDKYQWILTQMIEGKDKDGNPKMQTKETYHGTLHQVCGVIIDRKCGKCGSLEEVKQLLIDAKNGLNFAVSAINK